MTDNERLILLEAIVASDNDGFVSHEEGFPFTICVSDLYEDPYMEPKLIKVCSQSGKHYFGGNFTGTGSIPLTFPAVHMQRVDEMIVKHVKLLLEKK